MVVKSKVALQTGFARDPRSQSEFGATSLLEKTLENVRLAEFTASGETGYTEEVWAFVVPAVPEM